ncbi:MAG: hypothetical protein GF383_12435 [Candidatus Lokiarchaeota archaeon]|nr:hypothetical protein [Candidatus Lokiarchaeota archaeon]MBD3341809.1 hypothetical protein [Candidatus Lokiarchaeota archaeon]
MEKSKEISLIIGVIALLIIIGVSSLFVALALGEELHLVDPIHAYTHHLGNWLVWLIFGIALTIGILIFIYFKKKNA